MNRKELGTKMVKDAGKLLLKFYNKFNPETAKGRRDFTLEADLEAEKLIISQIKKNFSKDNVNSEEAGEIKGKSEYRWVVDPLDGTANFKARIPYFCVSIGLEKNNELAMSFVYDPLGKNMYFAKKGNGAFINGKQMRVSQINKLKSFLISYSTSNHKTLNIIRLGSDCFEKILRKCRAIRLRGSSILDFCNLANGTFDGLVKVGASYWDFAPGCLIVEEAGGKVTDFSGNVWNSKTKNLVASNKIKHGELLKILRLKTKK